MSDRLDSSPDTRPLCAVCRETMLCDAYALLGCSHVFHEPCIRRWVALVPECPVCRSEVTVDVLADLQVTPTAVAAAAAPSPDADELQQPFPPHPDAGHPYREEEEEEGEIEEVWEEEGEILQNFYSAGYFPTATRRQDTSYTTANSPAYVSPSEPGTNYFSIYRPASIPSPRRPIWEDVFNQLIAEDRYMDFSDDESELPALSSPVPCYYRTSTLEFLENLNLSEEDYDKIILFKRRYGKNALCDAVNRTKVFLALDDRFRFTTVDDMLHRCRSDPRSARIMDKIYLKYIRSIPLNIEFTLPSKGTVYDFFNIMKPTIPNRASESLERSFRKIINEIFGVQLPKVYRDLDLYEFYRHHPNNLHNVLQFAKLRQDEISLKRQMNRLKRGDIGCKRR